MKKGKLITLIIVIVLILLVLGFVVFKALNNKSDEKEPEVINKAGDYVLKDTNTEYFKTLFNQLKEILNSGDVDDESYAKVVAQLFVADFFDLNSKLTSNDIGGIQFVYQNYQNDFINYAKESIYEAVENNIDGTRVQDLPVVHSATVGNVVKQAYNYLDTTDPEAYYIDLVIGYEKNLGYMEDIQLILIHSNNKIEVAEMKKGT